MNHQVLKWHCHGLAQYGNDVHWKIGLCSPCSDRACPSLTAKFLLPVNVYQITCLKDTEKVGR